MMREEMNMRNEATPKGDNIKASTSDVTPKHPPFKNEVALYALLNAGPKGICQHEAQAAYREARLNSTISEFRKKGINCISLPDYTTIVYYNQKPFHRYWLATDKDRERALRLLNQYRNERGMPSVYIAPWHDTDEAA